VNATVAQTGAGTINAVTALQSKTSISQAKFNLLDTAHIEDQTVTITNNGHVPVTYRFSVQPSEGFNFFGDSPFAQDNPYYLAYPYPLIPKVSLPGTIRIQGSSSATVKFKFSPPEVANASAIPIYSGKIAISGDNGDELGITYLGTQSSTLQSAFLANFHIRGSSRLTEGPEPLSDVVTAGFPQPQDRNLLACFRSIELFSIFLFVLFPS
jgi:hypothetical protein